MSREDNCPDNPKIIWVIIIVIRGTIIAGAFAQIVNIATLRIFRTVNLLNMVFVNNTTTITMELYRLRLLDIRIRD